MDLYNGEMNSMNGDPSYESQLNQTDMANTCHASSCIDDGLPLLLQLDSSVTQNGTSTGHFEFLIAFNEYVCQQVDGEYCFPAGATSMAKIFNNFGNASVPDLDTFCDVHARCPKLSISKFLSIMELVNTPSSQISFYETVMQFSCMNHNGVYCLKVLDISADTPFCDGYNQQNPNLDNSECVTWIQNKVDNGGCCIKAYGEFMNLMNSYYSNSSSSSSSKSLDVSLDESIEMWQYAGDLDSELEMEVHGSENDPSDSKDDSEQKSHDSGDGNPACETPPAACQDAQAGCCPGVLEGGVAGPSCPAECTSFAQLCCGSGNSTNGPYCSAPPTQCPESAKDDCCPGVWSGGAPGAACPAECTSFAQECCASFGMTLEEIVNAVGRNYNALPEACSAVAYQLPVEFSFLGMDLSTCNSLLPTMIKDIAASTGVIPSQVVSAVCTALTTKSSESTGSSVEAIVGVATEAEANNMNTDVALTNTELAAVRTGVVLGNVTVVARTDQVAMGSASISPSPTASSESTSGACSVSATLALALVSLATLWLA